VAGFAPALSHILLLLCDAPLSGRVFSPRRTAKLFRLVVADKAWVDLRLAVQTNPQEPEVGKGVSGKRDGQPRVALAPESRRRHKVAERADEQRNKSHRGVVFAQKSITTLELRCKQYAPVTK